MAVLVLAAHGGLLVTAVVGIHSTTPAAPTVTPPAITGVLVAEASQELSVAAPSQLSQAAPDTPRARAPLPPDLPTPAPAEHAITVPEPPEMPQQPDTPQADSTESAPRPRSVAVLDAARQDQSQAAPPVTPPVADAAYLRNPAPVYPQAARRRGEQGEVLLNVFIHADGSVGEITVKRSSGYTALDQSAIDAVRKWSFVPARRGSEPIPYLYELPIHFSLTR